MDHVARYASPLGTILLASDGAALVGLWFEGQKHFGRGLDSACKADVSSRNVVGFPPHQSPTVLHHNPSDCDVGSLPDGQTDEPVGFIALVTASPQGEAFKRQAFPLRGRWHGEAVTDEVSVIPQENVKNQMSDLPALEQAARWLDIYFSGRDPDFTPPLSLRGTAFERSVWAELAKIPRGQTATYGEIAARLGLPRGAARAVGGAVGRNPVSLIVPCHRVVGANGRLAGYAGGLERKRFLLALEGSPKGSLSEGAVMRSMTEGVGSLSEGAVMRSMTEGVPRP